MTPEQIGIVYNELRQSRILFSQAVPGRRRSEGERRAVGILSAAMGRLSDLEDFLETQGLKLVQRRVQEFGIAGEGQIYAVIRDPSLAPPTHLRGGEILRELIDSRREETTEVVGIRSTFFLLALLFFLYTRDDRPIEAVSAFKDSSVEYEEFLFELKRRISGLKSERNDHADTRRSAMRSALTDLSDKQIENRAEAFLRAMQRVGVLEEVDDLKSNSEETGNPVFRQTLWSALDLAENFRRYAPHLTTDDTLEQIDQIGSAIAVAEDSSSSQRQSIQEEDA